MKEDWSRLEHKVLIRKDGKYLINIDISVNEWKTMLQDENIFYEQPLCMILEWYFEEDHLSTSKEMMTKYYPKNRGTPYNGFVNALSYRIINHLNRFWVEDSNQQNKKSYWCIPFEGWHVNYDESEPFVWKVRSELVEAIDILLEEKNARLIKCIQKIGITTSVGTNSELTSIVKDKEGKKISYYTTKYERSSKNRQTKINSIKNKHLPLCCEVCGFNFERVYGELGKDFIEVHHNKPLYSLESETEINPEKDLNCLCSNCHRMIHRRSEILTVAELQNIMCKVKFKNQGE